MAQVSEVDRGAEGDDLLVVDRVERDLRETLTSSGTSAIGKLPQERDLALQYGVSRRSIREAIARLKRDRLVRAVPGKGTFVVARSKQRTGVLLFNNDSLHSYNLMCVGVLSDVLRKRGHAPVLVSTSNPAADWDSVMRDHPEAIGGVLVGVFAREVVEQVSARAERPLVLVSDMDESFRGRAVCDSVLNDNHALAYAGVEQLVRQGHRRIALLGWDFSKVWTREMERGYEDALRVHGIEPQDDWKVDLPSSTLGATDPQGLAEKLDAIRQRVRRWSTQSDAPTAVLHSAGDETRMRDVLENYFLGRFRGDQIMVATFRETLTTAYTGMSDATAVCARFEDIANKALDLLLRERRKGDGPTREIQSRVFTCVRRHGAWQDQTSE